MHIPTPTIIIVYGRQLNWNFVNKPPVTNYYYFIQHIINHHLILFSFIYLFVPGHNDATINTKCWSSAHDIMHRLFDRKSCSNIIK